MNVDQQQLKRVAPLAVPLVILAAGWFALIRPAAAESTRIERQLDSLRGRISSVRALMGEPPPPALSGDPIKAFERRVAQRDASGPIVAQLLTLARAASIAEPSIETGERGQLGAAGAPRVAGTAEIDPRFQLFGTQLSYTPVTMAFDADYASLGDFLWRLRDLATVIELRRLEIARPAIESGTPAAATAPVDSGKVRVTVTVYAYARPADVPQATSGVQAGR